MRSDDYTLRELKRFCEKIIQETSTEEFVELDINNHCSYYCIEVKSKLIVSEVIRKYIITMNDFSMGDEHLYELIKAVHWSVWVMVDKRATDNRPLYQSFRYDQ